MPFVQHATACTAIAAAADVAVAEPDYGYRLARTPNDALYGAAPRYSGMWFLNSISAPAAWDLSTGDPAVRRWQC